MPVNWNDALEKVLAGDQLGNFSWNDLGKPIWRDGVMTESTSPLQLLSDQVVRGARSPEARDLAARVACPRPSRRGRICSRCSISRDADGRPAIRILERLATRAPDEPLAALGSCTCLARTSRS